VLDNRKSSILEALVEVYIESAQPVGSGRLASVPAVDVSPATVRSELAYLEASGYLVQPHTSAGRIPTEKGYRFFVDNLTEPTDLDAVELRQVHDFFGSTPGELERILQETSNLLASMTGSAGVVVAPDNDHQIVRSVQLADLGAGHALLVIVTGNGSVEKHALELANGYVDQEETLSGASAHLSAHLRGHRLAALPPVPPTGQESVDEILTQVGQALRDRAMIQETAYVGGASLMAQTLVAPEQIRLVLDLLERQIAVVGLIRDLMERGLRVAIGSETGLDPLADCSLVVAPYEIGGEPAGSIGVLGSTRMDYPQVLATVAVVGRRLGARLTEG
tara:strand:- start:660 stop:1664 length:1005 start_codon:yes stop_codon:yes gene_type:complete